MPPPDDDPPHRAARPSRRRRPAAATTPTQASSSSPPPSSSSSIGSHEWSEFELRTALSLVCRGAHRTGDALGFATALNAALNAGDHGRDVPVGEVRRLLARLRDERKGALAFIERQVSRRVTRTAARVFARGLDFDGSLREWLVEGRRERVERARLGRRREQVPRSLENGGGDAGRGRHGPLLPGPESHLRDADGGERNELLGDTPESPTPDDLGGYTGFNRVTPPRQGEYSLDETSIGQVGTATASEVESREDVLPNVAPTWGDPELGFHTGPSLGLAPTGGEYPRPGPYSGPNPAHAPNSELGLAGGFAGHGEASNRGWGFEAARQHHAG